MVKYLLNVSCNLETKQFTFGKISEELKEIFLSLGIKKKDLERDSEFAYTIVKKVLVCLGNKTELKNSVVDQIEHNFPPPEEREKLRKQEEAAEAKLNSVKIKRRQTKRKGPPKQTQKPQPKPQPKPQAKPTPRPTAPAVKPVAKPVAKPAQKRVSVQPQPVKPKKATTKTNNPNKTKGTTSSTTTTSTRTKNS